MSSSLNSRVARLEQKPAPKPPADNFVVFADDCLPQETLAAYCARVGRPPPTADQPIIIVCYDEVDSPAE